MEGGIILAYDHDRAIYPFVHSGHGLDYLQLFHFNAVNRIDTTLPFCLSQETPHLESCVRISTAIRFTRELFSDRRIKSVFHAKLLWKSESGEGCVRREGGAKGLLPNQSNF